jgi:alpha-tubulin suppressor-like RCC1 family protein
MIACGNRHNIILTENNELYVCGDNINGKLGLGDYQDRNKYTKLEHNFGKIKNIYCGESHNIILNENNELYVCGSNFYYQLGLGDNKNRNAYTKLEHNFGKIKNIYCGAKHNIILNENNEVYVCGHNYYGQLGLGDYDKRNVYTKLENNFGKIINIYCAGYHNIILNENNELYVCGYNDFGQLGLGYNDNKNIHTKIENNFGKIKNIYCGRYHNIILNENNELYVCGNNEFGQLGLGDNNKKNTYTKLEHNFGKIKNIYCGGYYNIILNENNELYVCGINEFGQLGLGSLTDPKPNSANYLNSQSYPNKFDQFGLGDYNKRNKYTKLEHNLGKIKNIYCGGYHNIILNDNNELYVCGFNYYGQLGLGDYNDRNVYTKLDLHFDIFNKKPIANLLELNLGEIII